MRVGKIEPLGDEAGVMLVLGEYDRLAEPVAGGDLLAVGHQMLEDLVDGISVEEPPVDGGGVHAVGDLAVLVPLKLVPLVLLVFRQVVIADALPLKAQRHGDGPARHEEAILDGFVEGVGIRGDAALQVEEAVGVAVDLVLRRGGQAHEEAVEVLEDRAVLFIDRAVGLIDDDHVEVAGAEAAASVLYLVDKLHHRGVSRDVDPAGGVPVRQQVDRRRPRQVRLEGVGRLLHEGPPVGEE